MTEQTPQKSLYSDEVGPEAYATYTVYVDCGEAEAKFKAFLEGLGDAVEVEWQDRNWKG